MRPMSWPRPLVQTHAITGRSDTVRKGIVEMPKTTLMRNATDNVITENASLDDHGPSNNAAKQSFDDTNGFN